MEAGKKAKKKKTATEFFLLHALLSTLCSLMSECLNRLNFSMKCLNLKKLYPEVSTTEMWVI